LIVPEGPNRRVQAANSRRTRRARRRSFRTCVDDAQRASVPVSELQR
jgi:hypothetical protein